MVLDCVEQEKCFAKILATVFQTMHNDPVSLWVHCSCGNLQICHFPSRRLNYPVFSLSNMITLLTHLLKVLMDDNIITKALLNDEIMYG